VTQPVQLSQRFIQPHAMTTCERFHV